MHNERSEIKLACYTLRAKKGVIKAEIQTALSIFPIGRDVGDQFGSGLVSCVSVVNPF